MLLHMEPDQFFQLISDKENKQYQRQSLERELDSLEAGYNRNINACTEMERKQLNGEYPLEVYRRLKAQLQAERTWVEERLIAAG